MRNLRFERQLRVPPWNGETRRQAIDFWERRGFQFHESSSQRQLMARRGNVWGNLTSFEMHRVMTTLTIIVDEENEAHFVLDVNPIFQLITEYNIAELNLEMDTFSTFLFEQDEQEERRKRFRAKNARAFLLWSFTFGAITHKPPPDDRP